MGRLIALVLLLFASAASPAFAQDITGNWQGTLADSRKLRIVLQVSPAPSGELAGSIYVIDQSPSPFSTAAMTLKGADFSFTVPNLGGTYTGKLESDGKSIKGTWKEGVLVTPMEFVKPAKAEAWATDPTPHKVSFVTTDDGVKLEVLDWGGAGKPLVMIAGLGADAHVFDKFIASLAGKYRIYGVTRRGYGASDRPSPANASYTADRMGDDVLTVIDALKLDKPVLAGWSIGGQELSSIGSRYPEKVSGLVYLDAGYAYSFYAPGNSIPFGVNLSIDANDIKAKINRLSAPGTDPDQGLKIIDELLNTAIPQLQADLAVMQATARQAPRPATPMPPPPPQTEDVKISRAILTGGQKYTKIDVPVLAFFAPAGPLPPTASETDRKNYDMRKQAETTLYANFRAGLPHAKVVVLNNAQHAVFNSNPAEVASEMSVFIDGLK